MGRNGFKVTVGAISGIIDQQIDRTEALLNVARDGFDGSGILQIGDHNLGATAAARANPRRDPRQRIGAARDEHQIVPARSQSIGERLADAHRSSGN
jgi:hypothetical protein